jgi:hypothetical protein
MGWRCFGFVYHSRTLFCRAVPNPNLTIRNFCIAVRPQEREAAHERSLVAPDDKAEQRAAAKAIRAAAGLAPKTKVRRWYKVEKQNVLIIELKGISIPYVPRNKPCHKPCRVKLIFLLFPFFLPGRQARAQGGEDGGGGGGWGWGWRGPQGAQAHQNHRGWRRRRRRGKITLLKLKVFFC